MRDRGWEHAASTMFAGDALLQWIPVIDKESCPVALAGRPLVPGTEPRLGGIDRIGTDVSVVEAARRAMRRPVAERLVPFLRCDSRGRYVGLVRVERLVEDLALAHERATHDPRVTESAL